MSAPAAVVLDVDGTLVDSNYQHVLAWWRAFLEAGHEVSCFDVHRAIGLPSEDLVQHLLGHADDRVVEGHTRHWERLRPDVLAFHRAADLVRACHERGLRVVWATSGSEDDVRAVRDLLDCDEAVHAFVSTGDVAHGKPAPDVVLAALRAADVPAERAVMVGDTVFDVRAARAAGVGCVALLSGGLGESELRQDDPLAVFGNCADLLDGLDDSPVGALLA